MARIGSWGPNLTFEVNSRKQLPFTKMKRSVKARWAAHNLFGEKPKMEYQGVEQTSVTMEVTFSAQRGQSPYACLTKLQCKTLMEKAHSLGLEVLLEMHSEEELEYVDLQPDLCGINNRHLGSFVTDVEHSFRMAELLPADVVKVSESGIGNPATVRALRESGFRGFLIGESFMKTPHPGKALHDFIAQL